jgi:hypothetical protein
MRSTARLPLAAAVVFVFASLGAAQVQGDLLTAQQITVACAPPPLLVSGEAPLHVTGTQDTVARSIYSERDLIIVDGGTGKGVQVGQRFFTRRPTMAALYTRGQAGRSIETAGWLRIVAVNETTAIGLVEHVCSYIQTGDYLEPFSAVDAPEAVREPIRPADLDFTALSRVLYGPGEQVIASAGGFMTIDRGADQGVRPGTRFAIYRDVPKWVAGDRGPEPGHLPFAAIGEAVVVRASPKLAIVRIDSARDAVQRGDYAVPHKP